MRISFLPVLPRLRALFLSALMGASGACLYAADSSAEEIAIGVGEFSKELNVLTSDDLVARLVRGGATRGLLAPVPKDSVVSPASEAVRPGREATLAPYTLALADSVALDAAHSKWSFRIRGSEAFSNGLPVRPEDVLFSLRRCQDAGIVPRSAVLSAATRTTNRGVREDWVFVSQSDSQQSPSRVEGIAWEVFSQCPILEEGSSERFGADLGVGSNLVASGYFLIEDFFAGREITLARTRGLDTGAGKIVLRGFRDGLHALTALRTGTIDLFFTEDEEVLTRARGDQTLLSSECSGYRMIQRKGLQVRCGRQVELNELKYLS